MEYKFREVNLPSGAVLQVQAAPFAVSKALYQAVLKEAKALNLGSQNDAGNLMKDLLMTAYSSAEIEKALWACFGKCLYNGLKIDKDTFEPEAAREDYVFVCMEVAQDNISPFGKSLYAVWSQLLALLAKPTRK